MRWTSRIVAVIALMWSLGVAVSAGQDSSPSAPAPAQDAAAKQQAPDSKQAPDSSKDAAATAKQGTQKEAKSEGKDQREPKALDKTEGKADAKPENHAAEPQDNANANAEGQAEPKAPGSTPKQNVEPEAEDKTKAETGSPVETNAETSKNPSANGSADTAGGGAASAGAPVADNASQDVQRGDAASPSVPGAKDDQVDVKPASETAAPEVVTPRKAPRKIVVREGGASEPEAQIVTGMSAEEASRERLEAQKFIDAADENLKRLLGRILDAQQQESVSQIHNYVAHARSALKEGDISRGHTLALKASLLADDLVKH